MRLYCILEFWNHISIHIDWSVVNKYYIYYFQKNILFGEDEEISSFDQNSTHLTIQQIEEDSFSSSGIGNDEFGEEEDVEDDEELRELSADEFGEI